MQKSTFFKLLLYSFFLIITTASVTYYLSTNTSPIDRLAAPFGSPYHVPSNNCEIRNWYNYQVLAIPKLNEYWESQNMNIEERALKAYTIRHDARSEARFMMPNKDEVRQLEERDLNKYGTVDGPSFQSLIEKEKSRGKTGDEIYQAIIESSSRTSAAYNAVCN